MRYRYPALSCCLASVSILAVLAGCATRPAAPEVVRYRCEDDRRFTLSIAAAGGAAQIEFGGMRFALHPAPSATVPGDHFACDVLTVWRTGTTARVEMDGDTPFRACVVE